MSLGRIGRALIGSGSFTTPREVAWTVGAITLEAGARGLGHFDQLRHRSNHIWETAVTTKQHIASADAQRQQSVLVFNIVNYHRMRLELGQRAVRTLTQQVTQHVEQALDPRATVSIQPSGTIVVVLPGDREEAEGIAQQLMDELEKKPMRYGGSRDAVSVKVACGIIAFSRSGQAHAESITASALAPTKTVMAT